MTAETIAKALGGRKAGGGWMARCPAHDDREPSLSISDAQGRQGARALPCRMRPARRDRRPSGARPVGSDRPSAGRIRRASIGAASPTNPIADALKRSEAALAIWQASQAGRGNAGRDLSRARAGSTFRRRRRSASMPA